MEAKNILEKFSFLEEKKEKEEKKKVNILEQNKTTESFIRYQHKCSREKKLCVAFRLKMLPTCKKCFERCLWKGKL